MIILIGHESGFDMRSNKNLKKTVIVVLIIFLITAFKFFALEQYLSLSYLKSSQEKFSLLYTEHKIFVIAAYMMFYIIVTSLSLPGAVVLTLVGGALFELQAGTYRFFCEHHRGDFCMPGLTVRIKRLGAVQIWRQTVCC